MRVAVTGASGFIGLHVLKALQSQDVEIIAVTRNADKLPDRGSSTRIVELDIYRVGKHSFNKLGRPEVLIHLAWNGLPNYRSLHHFETELPAQYFFLKGLIEAGLPSVLVSGTCFEYGMQTGALSEDQATQPDNSYGYAKDALRKQLQFLKKQIPFKLNWARLFYMYGEDQVDTSLYPALKAAVLRGDRVFNMSGGEQLRDFLPVEEVARRIVILALSGADYGIVNVCSGKPISIRNLVQQWIEENGWQIELNPGYYPYPDYEPMEFWGNSKRINSILKKYELS